jgi:DNA excision repair protein ERCC-6
MLVHWLKELAKWAPGLRCVLIHQSGEVDGRSRTVTPQLLQSMDNWLKSARRNRLFEAIDEEDLETRDPQSFCGTAYAFVTTYENIRRNPEIWTNHNWSYVVMDEAQKIRNPDADVTLACKVRLYEYKSLDGRLCVLIVLSTTHFRLTLVYRGCVHLTALH